LKNTSTKDNKYVVNQKLESPSDQIYFRLFHLLHMNRLHTEHTIKSLVLFAHFTTVFL
jgi:hypothetical protein